MTYVFVMVNTITVTRMSGDCGGRGYYNVAPPVKPLILVRRLYLVLYINKVDCTM